MTAKVFCQGCSFETLPTAKFCARCGNRAFGPQPPPQPAVVQTAPAPVPGPAKPAAPKYCTSCSEKVLAAALFCPACGNRTFAPQPPGGTGGGITSPPPPPPRRPPWKDPWMLGGALAATLSVAVAGYLYLDKQEKNRQREAEAQAAQARAALEAKQLEARKAWGRGNRALEDKDADKAIAEYGEAIRLWPEFAGAYVSRGNARLFRTEEDQALADYEAALRADANYPDAYLARGSLRWLKGELDAAETDLRKLVSLKRADPFAYQRLTQVLGELRKPREVEALYRAAYDEDRSRDWALESWLLVYARNSGDEPMLAEIAKLEAAGQGDASVLFPKASALMRLKRYGDAIPVLRRVLEGDPAKVPTGAALNLAQAYKATGDRERCREALRDYGARMGRADEMDLRGCD